MEKLTTSFWPAVLHILNILQKKLQKRVEFIAPVIVYAGENEMESLALGALRVQRGEEEARTFTKVVPE